MSYQKYGRLAGGFIVPLVLGSFTTEAVAVDRVAADGDPVSEIQRKKSKKSKKNKKKKNKKEDRRIVVKAKNGLEVKTKDGDYSIALRGRLQYDYNQFEGVINTSESETGDDAFVRRARLKIEAKIPDWSFKFNYDLPDGGSTDVLWANYEGFGDMFEVMVGQQKEGFGLEDIGSSKWISAIERPLPVEAFTAGKNLGIRLHGSNDSITYSLGVFKENFEEESNTLDRATTARLVYRPISKKKKLLHFGAGFSRRDGEFDEFSARLGSRGGKGRDANKIRAEYDRGAIGSRLSLWNLESVGIAGPYHVAAEYFSGEIAGRDDAPDLEGYGYYLQAGWVLTGETRRYKKTSASFSGVSPKGKAGAWELIARYDTLDVSDSPGGRFTDIDGGVGRTVTLGVNWYGDDYFKASANYVRAETDETFGGVDDGNALAVRFELIY